MKQNTSLESTRFAPLVLAVVLLAVVGFVALRVYAQEVDENITLAQTSEDVANERALVEEQQEVVEESEEETQQSRQQQREEMEAMMDDEQGGEGAEVRREQSEDRGFGYEDRASALREQLQVHKAQKLQNNQKLKAKFSTERQVRLGQYVERITVRMNAAIDRLEQIAGRVLTRVESMEEDGTDLSAARSELENVYIAISDARKFVTLFSEVSIDAVASENPAAQVLAVRESAQLAKETIKSVHTALATTVQLVKASTLVEDVPEEEEVTE